jgi:hypothetical protein
VTWRRDTLGAALLVLAAGAPAAVAACGSTPPPGEIVMVLASHEVPFVVEGERTEVSIDAPADLPEREAAAGPGLRVALALHGVESPRSAGSYDVYAGLPAGAAPDPKGPYHLGTLAPFGPVRDPEAAGGPVPAPAQVSYDLTALMKRLAAEGRWDDSLELTFVRRGLLPPVGKKAQDGPTEVGPIRVEMVRIVRWRG